MAYAFLHEPDRQGHASRDRPRRPRAVPGVLDVLTHETVGDRSQTPVDLQGGDASEPASPRSAEIAYDGQIVAIVVADTFEAAREAAYQVGVDLLRRSRRAPRTSDFPRRSRAGEPEPRCR